VGNTQQVGVRLPVDLYERLRRRAFADHRTQTDIVHAATEAYLDRLDERDVIQDQVDFAESMYEPRAEGGR